jgi:hypothetical protein
VEEKDFRVYLVAHSMGGLICRAFLQNPKLGSPDARSAVDKLFTYATPHNGIDLRVVRNVPGWSALGEVANFNRDRMAQYLSLPVETRDVCEIRSFPPERIFNLIGTNPADYLVLRGLSSWAVGEASDGLVRIENAVTYAIDSSTGKKINSPRAFAYRSHSGHYGIVNSEEGYQNLTRFLFGSVRVDGFLDVNAVMLPDEIQEHHEKGGSVRASYGFEIVAALRGSQWQLHRRSVRENSAIQRTYDELFPKGADGKRRPQQDSSPHLFSVFLDSHKSMNKETKSVAFAFDLSVLVPDYQIDGVLWLDKHYEGGYLYRELILVEATLDTQETGGWNLTYGYQSETPNVAARKAAVRQLDDRVLTFSIPVNSPPDHRPGIVAVLRIELQKWN